MKCAWDELLSILPNTIRKDVVFFKDKALQELRLRINAPPELILADRDVFLTRLTTESDLNFVINSASQYSPWASTTISQGYLTAPGGHRIGICGETACQNGRIQGFCRLYSLCIRIARDHSILKYSPDLENTSILILGAPGWGKTTFLRDLTRQIAQTKQVCVVDERKELFPEGFRRGKHMDILSGCPKADGIEMVLRTMGPDCIAVDEITASEDCQALIQSANCGVLLIATAHAAGLEDFRRRKIYHSLIENKVFQSLVLLRQDKSYTWERMAL